MSDHPFFREPLYELFDDTVIMDGLDIAIKKYPSVIFALFDLLRVYEHNVNGLGIRNGSYFHAHIPELRDVLSDVIKVLTDKGGLDSQIKTSRDGFTVFLYHNKNHVCIDHFDCEGHFLGYPSCCIDEWGDMIASKGNDNGRVMVLWEQNVKYNDTLIIVQDPNMGNFHRIFGYTGFTPCSPECSFAIREHMVGKEIWNK